MAPLETENELKYKDQGFHVLAFYSNDFGNQGGNPEECPGTVGLSEITMPQFVIDHVVGPEARPVFKWLVDPPNSAPAPTWNFHKYLIARDGTLVGHWGIGAEVGDRLNTPNVEPNELAPFIEAELAKPKP